MFIGQTQLMSCRVIHGADQSDFLPYFTWYKLPDLRQSIRNDTSGRLTIEATSMQQSGSYICSTTMANGTSFLSKKADIQIKGRFEDV